MAERRIDLTSLTGLRKVPEQRRSRERVERIIATAEKILEDQGYSALTMRSIAEAAGVPNGTVYQFFDDKAALVDIVVQLNIAGFEQVLTDLSEAVGDLRVEELIDTVFDTFVQRNRRNRAYMVVRSARALRPERQDADDRNIERLAHLVHRALVHRVGVADRPEVAVACQVAIQTADALLALAFRADPHGDTAILSEARRIAHLYISDIVARGAAITTGDAPGRAR